jgi:putative tricarboxylic transport membrane protein
MKLSQWSGDSIIASILFLVGLSTSVAARSMPPGDFSVPGPGFVPMAIGVLLCFVSLAMGISATRYRADTIITVGHRNIWAIFVLIVLTGILLERLGFIATITAFVSILFILLSRLRLLACISWALVFATVAYFLFDRFLGVPLPAGNWITDILGS